MLKFFLSFFLTGFFLIQAAFAASSVAPELEALGLRPEIVKRVDPRLKKLFEPEDQYFLEVKLGKITRAQYDGLMDLYGRKSKVPYDANRAYDLLDFLPPFIQATANQVFLPKNYNTERLRKYWGDTESPDKFMILKNGIASFTNCWNTTIEVLRSLHPRGGDTVFLYWPGRWTASDEMQDDEFMRKLPEGEARIGDVLMVLAKGPLSVPGDEEGVLQHTAYLVTSGLVFERTDTSENDAYRISYRADVEQKYRRVFSDEERLIQYRRFVGADFFDRPTYTNFSDRESWDARDEALLQRLLPGINTKRITAGCETGMGGGCDVVTIEAHEAKIVTNPQTGRGILYAPRALLDRFVPLKARP